MKGVRLKWVGTISFSGQIIVFHVYSDNNFPSLLDGLYPYLVVHEFLLEYPEAHLVCGRVHI